MKYITNLLFAFLLLCGCSLSLSAVSPKREFRATWVTTHYGIDWPTTKITSPGGVDVQKKELIAILNKLQAAHMNAFTFQVRPVADAFYKSSYEPWSDQLTGTRGQDPGYDPLAFAIEEAHKRGMELHAWVNPYRYEIHAGDWGDEDTIRKTHPDWLLTFNNSSFDGTILDPGLPETRAYTVNVIREIVENYDIDGIIFDDYFYPYGGTKNEDAATAAKYKPANQSLGDWRRANVDKLVKDVYEMIQATKPWVRFGQAPSGIWTTDASAASKYGITNPSTISGCMDAYNYLYCNTLEWIKQGTVDYVAPQIYWSTTATKANYKVLTKWWGQMVKKFSDQLPSDKKVHFFSSNNAYSSWVTPKEMGLEVETNRTSDLLGDGTGAIFYNTEAFLDNELHTYFAEHHFAKRAIMPAMDWKETPALDAPTDIQLDGMELSWTHPTAPRFTIYAFPKGTDKTAALSGADYLMGISYTHTFDVSEVIDLKNSTFAVCAYDRYGNEYAPAFFNDGPAENPQEKPLPEGELTFQLIWKHAMEDSDYALDAKNNNRSIAYYDDKLYLPYKGTGEIYVLDAATGKQLSALETGEKLPYLYNVRITEDGQLLYGNTGDGRTNGRTNIMIKTSSLTEGGKVTLSSAGTEGQSDYFYPYGEWIEKSFLLSLSNMGYLVKIPFVNGEMQDVLEVFSSSFPQVKGAKAIPAADGTSFYASAAGVIPTKHHIVTGTLLESFGKEKPTMVDASGLAVLTIGGHEYMVTPTNTFGSFEVFDISRGLELATKVSEVMENLGTATSTSNTIDFAVNIQDSCHAVVYVLSPNNGLAAYQFIFGEGGTGIDDIEVEPIIITQATHDGVLVRFEGTEWVRIYSANGVLLRQEMATELYATPLSQGMYIIQVGNVIQKFIR